MGGGVRGEVGAEAGTEHQSALARWSFLFWNCLQCQLSQRSWVLHSDFGHMALLTKFLRLFRLCFPPRGSNWSYLLCLELLIGLIINSQVFLCWHIRTEHPPQLQMSWATCLIRWLVIGLNCFTISTLTIRKWSLTLLASCKEPNYGISLPTVFWLGRRLYSDVVAWKAGAHTAEVKPWHFSGFLSDSGKWWNRLSHVA